MKGWTSEVQWLLRTLSVEYRRKRLVTKWPGDDRRADGGFVVAAESEGGRCEEVVG